MQNVRLLTPLCLFTLALPLFAQDPIEIAPKSEHTQSFSAPGPTHFEIHNGRGPLTIVEGTGTKIEIRVQNSSGKPATLETEETRPGVVELKIAPIASVKIVRSFFSFLWDLIFGGSVHFHSSIVSSVQSGQLKMEVHVPQGSLKSVTGTAQDDVHFDGPFAGPLATKRELKLTSTFGQVRVKNALANNTQVQASGKISVEKTDSNLTLSSTFGEAVVDSVNGNLDINAHNKATVKQSKGDLTVGSKFGEVDVKNQTGDKITVNGSGKIEIEGCVVTGEIALNGKFGPVKASRNRARQFTLSNKSGIEARENQGSIDATGFLNDVTIENQTAAVAIRIKTNGGKARFKGCVATDIMEATTGLGSVIASKNSAPLMRLITTGGDIRTNNNNGEIRTQNGLGLTRIENQCVGPATALSTGGNIYFNNPMRISENGQAGMGRVKHTSCPNLLKDKA